jgi:hypothetical protein
MTFTQNLKLIKPVETDLFTVEHANENMDKIDAAFGGFEMIIENLELNNSSLFFFFFPEKFGINPSVFKRIPLAVTPAVSINFAPFSSIVLDGYSVHGAPLSTKELDDLKNSDDSEIINLGYQSISLKRATGTNIISTYQLNAYTTLYLQKISIEPDGKMNWALMSYTSSGYVFINIPFTTYYTPFIRLRYTLIKSPVRSKYGSADILPWVVFQEEKDGDFIEKDITNILPETFISIAAGFANIDEYNAAIGLSAGFASPTFQVLQGE